MSDTTSRLGLPFPEPADEALIEEAVQPLAEALDSTAVVYGQGLLSARPAAGVSGRFYRASDTKILYYDTGAEWVSVPATNTVGATMLTDAFMALPRTGARWHNYSPASWAPSVGTPTDVSNSLMIVSAPAVAGFTKQWRGSAVAFKGSVGDNILTLFSSVDPSPSAGGAVAVFGSGAPGFPGFRGLWAASTALDAISEASGFTYLGLRGYSNGGSWQMREYLLEYRYVRIP